MPTVIIGYWSFTAATSAIEKQTFDQLTAIREDKKDQIERYIDQLRHQINTLSESTMTIQAMKDFDSGYFMLADEHGVDDDKFLEYNASLYGYYRDEMVTRLNRNLDEPQIADRYYPTGKETIVAQYLYIADNPRSVPEKEYFVSRDDGSRYDRAHKIYNPIFRSYLKKFGFYDIFLVNTQGYIVYTDFKEVDFGTNLIWGKHSNTSLGKAFRAALETKDHNFVYLSDFEPYDPSYAAPASFIGTAIFDGDKKIGVLLFQTPIDEINRVMTGSGRWRETGLGLTGETYIIGNDHRMRTVSRFLIEDRQNYLRASAASGTDDKTIEKIDKLSTTILLQSVKNPAIDAVLNGESGNRIVTDYRGVEVLNAYAPLNITDVRWAIIAKIDKGEAFASINRLATNSFIVAVVTGSIVVLISFLVSRSISKPIMDLKNTANEIARGKMSAKMTVFRKDEIGDLARSLDDMRYSLRMMIEDYEREKRPKKPPAENAGSGEKK